VVDKRGMYRCVKGKDYVVERSCVGVTALSVGVTVGAPVPLKVKPSWVSFHSLNVRIGICCLSNVPAHVVERPCRPAALMESSWLRHSSEKWRCSCLSSASMSVGRKGDKAFGADAVSGMPDQKQCVLDQRSNMMQAVVLR